MGYTKISEKSSDYNIKESLGMLLLLKWVIYVKSTNFTSLIKVVIFNWLK